MDSKIQQQLLDKSSQFLAQASHTLGQTAIHVYGVLVRQQIIDGIGTILQIVLFTVITFFSFKYYIKIVKSVGKKDEYYDYFGWILGGIFGGLGYLFLIGFITWALADGIQHILNPEYYAIQFIFNAATGQGN